MKKKIFSALSLMTVVSALSSASISAESRCTKDENDLEVLRSSWIDEDLAFLDGRKKVGYVFENNVLNYRIYQDGGFLGTVQSDPFYQEEIDQANELIGELNSYIDLELNEVPTRREADLVIIGVCEDGNTTGMVADNEFGDQYYLLLNGCNGVLDVEGQPVLLFLHELGHALGLEHPFDDSDGDCLHSDEPWDKNSTDDSVTVMAYKSSEEPVGFFTSLDLATLQSIHGVARGAPRNFLVDESSGGDDTHISQQSRELNTTCSFETSIEYLMADGQLFSDKLSQWGPLPVMTITNSMTKEDASDADDKNLATLSVIWTRVGEESASSIWAGDFGDLLTIHKGNESIGTHKATLHLSSLASARTYVGTCTGEF